MADWPPDLKEEIHRFAFVANIGASTRIENAILTDAEIQWIDTELSRDGRPTAFRDQQARIENKLLKDRERSIEEVAGCRAMLQIIYDQAPDFILTETTLRALHRELLQFYPPAAPYRGDYKRVPNSVIERDGQGAERSVLKTSDPGPMTEAAMHDLTHWYRAEIAENPWTMAVACEWVFRFLAIHPFQDGNGRLGRALFILALLQSPDRSLRYIARFIAIDRQIERHRPAYYQVLQQCSGGEFHQDPKQYQIQFFLQLMMKMMRLALQDIDFYRDRYLSLQTLSEAASRVYACFKEYPEKKLATQDIMAMIEIPRRTVIHSLNRLTEAVLIQKWGKGAGVRYQLSF